jgi:hypothetical protein
MSSGPSAAPMNPDGSYPPEQPTIHRLTRLGIAAAERGRGLPFLDEVSKIVWDGSVARCRAARGPAHVWWGGRDSSRAGPVLAAGRRGAPPRRLSNRGSSGDPPLAELLPAVHAEGASRDARLRVLPLGAASHRDPRVHDPAAIRTAAHPHDRASVVVVGTTLSSHSPRLLVSKTDGSPGRRE